MVKVSVIIPMYNSRQTIVRAVSSVMDQSFQDFEVFIINDGSTDDSLTVVEHYIEANQLTGRYHVITQPNGGPSSARNHGIELATGDFIAFLDSDDWWDSFKLEHQLKCFDSEDVSLVGCRCKAANMKSLPSTTGTPSLISFKELLFHNYFVTTSVVIARREVLEKLFFNKGMRYSEDYNLWLSISLYGKCKLLDEYLVYPDDKPSFGAKGLSANLWKMECGELYSYVDLYKNRIIGMWLFVGTITWSLLKFFRRLALTVVYRCFA